MAGFYRLIPPVVRFSGAWFLLCFGGFLYGQCPASFADFGELKVTLSAGGPQEITATIELTIPQAIRIDTSYLPKVIREASDGAGSNVSA